MEGTKRMVGGDIMGFIWGIIVTMLVCGIIIWICARSFEHKFIVARRALKYLLDQGDTICTSNEYKSLLYEHLFEQVRLTQADLKHEWLYDISSVEERWYELSKEEKDRNK